MTTTINRLVLDLSHFETVNNYEAVKASGIVGIIYKATQGVNFRDDTYWKERDRALGAGLLWGSYHFGEKGNVSEQVDHYLSYARPAPDELFCLDWEDSPPNTMRLDEVKDFLDEIESALRRPNQCVLYSGNTAKEALGDNDDPEMGSRRLWLCQYGTKPTVQKSWGSYWLWQYTDGKIGPRPHSVDGINDPVDCNSFDGTPEQLRNEWSGNVITPVIPEVKITISAPPGVKITVLGPVQTLNL